MQMTCTILHSGKRKIKPTYNPQKKDRKKILLPLLLYCPLLGISWATSEKPRSSPPPLPPTLFPLQPPYVHFIQHPPDRSSLSVGCSERLHFPFFDVTVKWWVLFFFAKGGGLGFSFKLSERCFPIPVFPVCSKTPVYTDVQCSASEASEVCVNGREVSGMPEGKWRRWRGGRDGRWGRVGG